jgi:hypothetical protein
MSERTLDLCCGGNCPVFHEHADGSVKITDGDVSISLTPEQANKAAAWFREGFREGSRTDTDTAELSRDLHDAGVF